MRAVFSTSYIAELTSITPPAGMPSSVMAVDYWWSPILNAPKPLPPCHFALGGKELDIKMLRHIFDRFGEKPLYVGITCNLKNTLLEKDMQSMS